MRAKYLLFLLIATYLVVPITAVDGKFDTIISLGGSCQPAINLSHHGLRHQSFPFDWLITPMAGILNFIAEEGQDFLNPHHLIFNMTYLSQPNGVYDKKYGFFFFHDFNYKLPPDTSRVYDYTEITVDNYAIVKTKFDRRVKRFFNLLRSDKKIVFVRLGITKTQALMLDHLLKSNYPQLKYLILALDNTEEMHVNWQLKRIQNQYINRENFWVSSREDWQRILAPFIADLVNQTEPNITEESASLLPEHLNHANFF